MVRQRSLLAPLVFSVLTNSVDMEGELPEELTAEMEARIEVEGRAAVVIRDTYSGPSFSGGRAPQALFSQITGVVQLLSYNTYKPVRSKRLDCETHILAGRRSAEIEAIVLDSETYAPGATRRAAVVARRGQGPRQRLPAT